MSELRECPFCGGNAYHTGPLLGMRYFHCQDCGAETSFRITGLHIDDQWERYNTRAIDEQAIREDERRRCAERVHKKYENKMLPGPFFITRVDAIEAIMAGDDK